MNYWSQKCFWHGVGFSFMPDAERVSTQFRLIGACLAIKRQRTGTVSAQVALPPLFACLCPEAAQKIRLATIQALRLSAEPWVQPICAFQIMQDPVCRSTSKGFAYSKNALLYSDQQYTYCAYVTLQIDHCYQVGDPRCY